MRNSDSNLLISLLHNVMKPCLLATITLTQD